jgi:hypothetical protein
MQKLPGDFFKEIINCISEKKLEPYTALFDSPKIHVPLTAHVILLSLSSAFYMPLQFMELTLRNKINNAMIEIYTSDKMRRRIYRFKPKGSTPENWYDWMPETKETKGGIRLAKIRAKKHALAKKKNVTHNDIISEITLGVWINILKEIDDNKNPFYFWEKAVNLVFPYRFHMKRNGIFYELDEALYIRNRLFHHEPIWKGADVKTFEDAVKKLHTRMFIICDIIAWMSQPTLKMVERFLPLDSFNEACIRGMKEFESINY